MRGDFREAEHGLCVLRAAGTPDRARSVARRCGIETLVACFRAGGHHLAALAVVLALLYGPVAFARTIFPLQGLSTYRNEHFGLLGSGRLFWDPGLSSIYYIVDFAGFSVLGGVFLMSAARWRYNGCGGTRVWRNRRDRKS